MNTPKTTPKRFRFTYQRKKNGCPGEWRAEQQGKLLAVANSGAHYQPEPGKKQPVTSFTPAARLNLLKKLNRVDWKAVGTTQFITLTYPDACWDGAYPDRTQQRTLLFRWIEEQTGSKRSILWKVEWKPRKSGKRVGEIAPHLHICVFRCRYLSWHATAKKWAKLIGADKVNVKGKRVAGEGAARYCAKYCSKEDGLSVLGSASYLAVARPGRHWGWTRQELMPWAPKVEVERLSDVQVARAMQVAATMLGKESQEGFLIFSEDAQLNIRFIIDGCTFPIDTARRRKYPKST